MTDITLRYAVIDDAEAFLEWRNDATARSSSHNSGLIQMEEHIAWLSAALNNPNRKLFIAEVKGQPIGTVRADLSEGVHELSWTVAPSFRGHGLAKKMVAILANSIENPIRAEIQENNISSIRVAEFSGMTIQCNKNGILHFKRGSIIRQ